MLRLGCEGVESQYISVVWEEKKKEKNTFIRKKEKKIREKEETECSRGKEHIQTTESSRKKRGFYTLWPNASFSLSQTDKIEGLTKIHRR